MINYKRVVETWFDEKHKEYFYAREPMAKFLDIGDISEQLALQKRLKCKSFQWFMDNVAYDVYDKYSHLPPNIFWGETKNAGSLKCMDAMGQQPESVIRVENCNGYGNNQLMRLNAAGQIGFGERCVEADSEKLKLIVCPEGTADGPWKYEESTSTIVHQTHKKCIAVHQNSSELSLLPCDGNDLFQQWTFNELSLW